MSIWAVIPAKAATQAKSRLSTALPPTERASLAYQLMERTVCIALAVPALAGVLVVSNSAEMRHRASVLGAQSCDDPATDGQDAMNAAIARGVEEAARHGAQAVLVLPTDLPLLTVEALTDFLDEANDAAVAVAPDYTGTGTNALLLRPPVVLYPEFGPNSYTRHRQQALRRGLTVAEISLQSLRSDLDTVDDLQRLGGSMSLVPCGGGV